MTGPQGEPAIIVAGVMPGEPLPAAPAGARLFLRTSRLLPGDRSVAAAASFDDLLAGANGFRTALDELVERLLQEAGRTPVVYVVPVDAMAADATVRRLRQAAAERGLRVSISPGRSLREAILPLVPAETVQPGLQLVDALDVAVAAEDTPFAGGELPVSPLRPVIVTNLDSPSVAGAAVAALARVYPPDSAAYLMAVGASGTRVEQTQLGALGQERAEDVTLAYVPPVDPLRAGRVSAALEQIVARLRAPGGCPWDREQTHESLRQDLIEEAYEVLEAIERGRAAELAEELGDLLLNAYLQAQIAEEAGEFTLADVFGEVTAKLVRRHPHVFGDVVADSAGQVLANWDRIKQQERAARGEAPEENPLGKIPASLPALLRAQTVIRRAARAGLLDLEAASTSHGDTDAERIATGLLALVAAADASGVDAEQALRDATRRIEDQVRRTLRAADGEREKTDDTF